MILHAWLIYGGIDNQGYHIYFTVSEEKKLTRFQTTDGMTADDDVVYSILKDSGPIYDHGIPIPFKVIEDSELIKLFEPYKTKTQKP